MITDIHNNPIRDSIVRDGYVVIDGLVPTESFQNLTEACDRVVAKARAGEWQHRRLVGTQFPPWTEGTDVWGVQHLMHPDLNEPEFAKWYGNNLLQEAVCELLGAKQEDLQLELFNLLINPRDTDFDLTWHRDTVRAEATEEEEAKILTETPYGTQWNTALYQDECLYVVPQSHNRVRTQREREITIDDPKSHEMPNMLKVVLKPGQTVFYDNNILHRAAYNKSNKRATMHACMGTIAGGDHRAKSLFQHGLGWMSSNEFKRSLPSTLTKAYQNTLDMAASAGLTQMEAAPIH